MAAELPMFVLGFGTRRSTEPNMMLASFMPLEATVDSDGGHDSNSHEAAAIWHEEITRLDEHRVVSQADQLVIAVALTALRDDLVDARHRIVTAHRALKAATAAGDGDAITAALTDLDTVAREADGLATRFALEQERVATQRAANVETLLD
jgi:hypothetical protein